MTYNGEQKMSLMKNVQYDKTMDCLVGKIYSTLLDANMEVVIDNDVSNEYIEMCIKHFNNLLPSTIDMLCDRLNQYYHFMLNAWQEIGLYENIVASINSKMSNNNTPHAILQHISPQTMLIEHPKQAIPAYSLECNCDWEPEHGVEIIIRENEILYAGQPTMLGPWCDTKEYICLY